MRLKVNRCSGFILDKPNKTRLCSAERGQSLLRRKGMIHLLPQWASRSHLKVGYSGTKTKQKKMMRQWRIASNRRLRGRDRKKGEKTQKHNSLSFSAQAEQLVSTQYAGFLYTLQRFELFKQVIYSRWRFRAQFATRTSRTGSCPTQHKHATLFSFFLCWTQKHPS